MAMVDQNGADPHWLDRLASLLANSRNIPVNRRLFGVAGAFTLAGAVSSQHVSTGSAAPGLVALTDVLGDAVTAEGLLVTLLGVARTRAGELGLDDATVRLVRATQCEEEAHFNNLVAAGASPSTGRYTISDQVFENPTSFLTTWMDLERIMVGMYMIVTRQIAASGDLDLVEMTYQIGVVEAQHLALLRQLSGERLPADRAFVPWQYHASAGAIAEIASLGFIGGKGTPYDYPGPGDRYCRGITGLVAETSADQSPPDVTPAPRQNDDESREQPPATPVEES